MKYNAFFISLRFISFLLIMALCDLAMAQPTSSYTFLDQSANVISQADYLKPFWEKLQALEEFQDRQLHVLHIGDSHIQADMFTGEVRNLLMKDPRFSAASRGFVFPYKLAKSNNPFDYEISYTGEWNGHRSVLPSHLSEWGIAGISASTIDASSTFTFKLAADQTYPITIIKLFYPVENGNSFQPVLQLVGKRNRVISMLKKKGMVEYKLEKPVREFTFSLKSEISVQREFLLQGLWVGNHVPGISYSASGVNGARVDTYFRCQNFYRDLTYLNPDLLIISLGTNEAFSAEFNAREFSRNMDSLLLGIREVAPDLPILLTTPGDSFRNQKPNTANATAGNVIKANAFAYSCSVWDFYAVMGGFQAINQWKANNLCQPDMLHLTPKGYSVQGELLYQAIINAYTDFLAKENLKPANP